MSLDFKKDLLVKITKFHRALYVLIVLIVLFCKFSNATESEAFLIYNLAFMLVVIVYDETLVYLIRKVNQIMLLSRSYVIVVGIATAGMVGNTPKVLFAIYIAWGILVIIEDAVLGNIFDDYGTMARMFSLSIILSLGTMLHMWNEFPGAWAMGFFFFIGCFVLTAVVEYVVIKTILKAFDDKYTNQMLTNEDLDSENQQLKTLQERVEQVNKEINYQKINLTKAYKDLENVNIEIRSLIEVMKFFSNSFDVEKNAYVMLQNIMKIKRPDICTIYLDKDVYGNDDFFIEVIVSDNEKYFDMAVENTVRVFDDIQLRNVTEPMVICDDRNFLYPYLTKSNISNAIAFPAVENDKIYGVVLVASEDLDFFESGITFYESSVTDFTSALISDRLYSKTEEMAKKDGLTQIYNRYYFNEFYNTLIDEINSTEGGTLSVAMLDIDFFKNINDTYGHLAGDEVIKTVARIDREFAKKHNGVAVRYGGEEFLLILKDKTVDEAYEILKEVHKEIKNSVINFNGTYIRINVSIGLAAYPFTNSDIYDVLDSADKALYYSKENGRGMIVIYGKEEEALNEDFSY